jgi:hypothetical protein
MGACVTGLSPKPPAVEYWQRGGGVDLNNRDDSKPIMYCSPVSSGCDVSASDQIIDDAYLFVSLR